MKKKRKSVLKLKNFTLEKFQLWKDMEGQIKETLGKYGVQLDNIVYDEEKNTKSFTVIYETTENLNRALISSSQFVANKGIEIEIVSSKDLPDNVKNLSLHKANKLMDQAETSIKKLKAL